MTRLALCVTLSLAAALITFWAPTHRLDLLLLDQFQAWLAPPLPDRIVLVTIDDASIAALGRWPWPRGIQARLIDAVAAAGPAAIGPALLLVERSMGDPAGDHLLVASVAAARNVVLPILGGRPAAGEMALERLPWPELAAVAAGIGHVDLPTSGDGLVRGFFRRAGAGSAFWPAFALALHEVARRGGADDWPGLRLPPSVETEPTPGNDWRTAGKLLIPLVGAGQLRRVSAEAMLEGRVDGQILAGRIVLIGVTASGIDAPVTVPAGLGTQRISALDYQGLVLGALLTGATVVVMPGWGVAGLTGLISLLAALSITHGRWPFLVKLACMAAACALSLLLFAWLRLWAPPTMACLAAAVSWSAHRLNEQRRTRAALILVRARHARMLSSIADAVLAFDAGGLIRFVNPAAVRLIGQPETRLLGRPLTEMASLTEATSGDNVSADGGSEHVAVLGRQDGSQRLVRVAQQSLAGGVADETMLVMSDVSTQVHATRELARLASHDALTGLPNRKLLIDRLEQGIARARRGADILALLFVDLDRFKTVNDGLGHAVGDLLLIEVASRLRRLTRASDTVGRLGGDEFVVLLDPLSLREDAGSAANRVLEALSQPFLLGQRDIGMSASVGIGIYPDDGADATELLRNADSAMYRSKQRGRACFHYFSPEMHRLALERLELEHGLRQALKANELVLHYQPTVDLESSRIIGVEALLRWQHPTRGLVGPAIFVPIAEETGLILPIGDWVIDAACRQGEDWAGAGLSLAKVAVNLSVRQFRHGNLLGVVRRTLDETGLPAERLMLEVTESLLMDDIDGATEILAALKEQGVQIALDDFGTGYSSLNYLKRLPLDCLKIDRSFVQRIGADPDDEAIVRAIIGLASTLRLRVIAEGVESEAQASFLRDNGCETAQGFLFGRPVPPAEVALRLVG